MSYPKTESPARPYHLWDANEKKALRWRYYSDPKRAGMGALYEVRWSKVGTVIEVFNAQTGRLLGQYVRGVNEIKFFDAKAAYRVLSAPLKQAVKVAA